MTHDKILLTARSNNTPNELVHQITPAFGTLEEGQDPNLIECQIDTTEEGQLKAQKKKERK